MCNGLHSDRWREGLSTWPLQQSHRDSRDMCQPNSLSGDSEFEAQRGLMTY